MSSLPYKADVSPRQAFEAMQSDLNAVMIDVRTAPEWIFVGQPKVARLANVSWQAFPAMAVNSDFEAQVRQAGITEEHEVYLLCRSGVRSAAAAAALTQAGFAACYNIAGGFEGDLNEDRQRGCFNGWKAEGLPWQQK